MKKGGRPPGPPQAPVPRQPEHPATSVTSLSYSGPLPPPQILRQFEEIVPGSAERILSAFEKESEHRREIEKVQAGIGKHAILHELADRRMGLVFGGLAAFGALGLAALALVLGHPLGAVATVIGTVASLAGVFIYGRRIQASREHPDDRQLTLPHTDDRQP